MSIAFKDVSYIYNSAAPFKYVALKNVDLNIEKGSFTALIGHTGSGKSTLIQHINALLLPTSGEVVVDEFHLTNKKTAKLKELRKKAGMVFQFPEYQLFEETIQKDIIFGPMNFGVSEKAAIEYAKDCMKMVGLDEKMLSQSPFELSGGQKRRVAIAGILAIHPDILVLDEPTAGLDPQGIKDMMDLFKSIHKSGVTVVMVTHDMNNVLEYCDHAIVMNKGKVEKHCTVEALFNEPEYLSDLSIDLPIVTSFILELNKNGFNIDPSIKTVDELIEILGGIL